MEAILGLILAFVSLGILWAAAAIFMAVVSFLTWMFTTILTATVAFFTGRWLWKLISTDYSEKDEADKD